MKIIKNGKRSSGQKTKHMDNRYFWIKDRLKSEEIQVIYCPTTKMIADFFTKPLQGNLFRKLRDVVMGYKHVTELIEGNVEAPDKERVRNNDKLREECETRKKGKEKKENMDTPGASPDVAKISVPDEKNSERKPVTWKDIVIGKRNVQKEEKDLILLKQSQL